MSVILRVNRDLKEMLIEVSEKWLPTINCGMPANAQFMPAGLLEGTTNLTKGANAAVAVAAIKASNFKPGLQAVPRPSPRKHGDLHL
jgi:hypothetical protein